MSRLRRPPRPRRIHNLLRPAIAHPWRVWLAENLLRGVPPTTLTATLVAHGVPPALAARGLRDAAREPALLAARRHLVTREREALAARLRRSLAALHPAPIERRSTPPADEFLARYYATNTPVIFTDLVPRWPAFTRWSPAHFRDHYGAVELEIQAGRASDPAPDLHFLHHRRPATMAQYVDLVLAAGETNDLYLIANNRNLARPGLRPLLADLELPPGYFDPNRDRQARSGALWFGPAGTVTNLHHDTASILFAQVVGRKRFRLYPPDDPTLLAHANGVYNRLDPEQSPPELASVPTHDITLAPGEALFLPVGWWHHVRALDLSISVAFNHFRWKTDFEWYKPGAIR